MLDKEDLWAHYAQKYRRYIRFERGMSANSVEAYLRDVMQFAKFADSKFSISPSEVTQEHIEQFMADLYDKGVKKSTQARVLSGLKSFFSWMQSMDLVETLPTEFVDSPKFGRPLPDVLTVEEVVAMIDGVDLSTAQGHRNRAIIEVLYGCGLRVSELISLKINDLFLDEGFIRVIGKGDKQRFVPIGEMAMASILQVMELRKLVNVKSVSAQIVFLNRRGGGLSREMIFHIIRDSAAGVGITKSISPHTLRHSFASHLLEGGANIRHIQLLLGHESIMTTEIYTHLDRTQLRDTVEIFHPLGNRR